MTADRPSPLRADAERAVRDAMSAVPDEQLGVEALRRRDRDDVQCQPAGPSVRSIEQVESTSGVPLGIYTPHGDANRDVVVYLHGGGFVSGGLETCEAFARHWAAALKQVVVTVGYRLAPEHPHPAALDDCMDALADVALRFPRRRLIVAGDSAGGNLAAVVALRSRANDAPAVDAQVLLYPVLGANLDTPTYRAYDGYTLTRRSMAWYWSLYEPDPAARAQPDCSPTNARDVAGVAPAVVMTAERDVLRDEAERYAARLRAAGVPVVEQMARGQVHGFLGNAPPSPDEAPTLVLIGRALGAFAGSYPPGTALALRADAAAELDRIARSNRRPAYEVSIETARRWAEEDASPRPDVAIGSTIDTRAGDVGVRVYHPVVDRGAAVIVYFHGGGFATGSLGSYDSLLRRLCAASDRTVVAAEYRLAPEHPYPAAVNDAHTVLQWTVASFPDRGVVLAGDSAGGNLAAVTALRAHERAEHVRAQVLIYPMCDSDLDTPTFRSYGDGYGLTREHMAWYWSMYAPNPATRHFADVTPLNAPDLHGLPPAMIITAGCDVLRDESERYAARLLAAGNTVLHRTYAGQIHGFLGNEQSPDSTDALAWIARGIDLLTAVATG